MDVSASYRFVGAQCTDHGYSGLDSIGTENIGSDNRRTTGQTVVT